jgi:hypothetical protein
MTAVAEVVGPIAAEAVAGPIVAGEHPIAALGEGLAGIGLLERIAVEDTARPSIVVGLAMGSLAVAAGPNSPGLGGLAGLKGASL